MEAMSLARRGETWFDDHRIAGYLLIAAVSGAAVAGTGLVLHGERISRAATSGTVAFAAAFLALLGWAALFRKAGVDS